MKHDKRSLRSPLGQVRALGSAKSGTEHWWMLRITSIILVPLSVYVMIGFFVHAIDGGYEGAIHWLRSPLSATFVVLFLVASFHHAANGLQVVIEDYVHCEKAKLVSLITIKCIAGLLVVLGVLATVIVLLGV
jgi:succinate dehydrogenase / fumarate reductase, membrane anchor subunit